MIILLYVILGITVGVFSGLVGIGGGILLVPALIFFFKLTQQQAQGTTLALLVPPIGLLAAWTYYKQGYVDLRIALFIAIGFILGSFFGAKISIGLPEAVLQRVFGIVLLLVGLKFLFFPK